jgi:hypothetical protein
VIKTGLNIWLVTFSFLDIFDTQAINDHNQFCVVKDNTCSGSIVPGEFKGAFFKSLIIENETGSLPMQEFDLVPAFIDENIYIPTTGITTKLVLYYSTEPIKAFSHVGRLTVQMESVFGRQGKHQVKN